MAAALPRGDAAQRPSARTTDGFRRSHEDEKEVGKMKFKSIARLLALSFVALTSVRGLAAQTAHPARLTRSARHKDAACRVACRHIDSYARIPAPPHVGRFAAPPDGKNCDVGDNPFIC
jgi:hypothetical protein